MQRPLASPALPDCKVAPPKDLSSKVPTYDSIVKTRQEKLNPGYLTYYKKPLYITQGSMQWLWDDQGHRYLDLFGGIVTVSVGHCHPRVVHLFSLFNGLCFQISISPGQRGLEGPSGHIMAHY